MARTVASHLAEQVQHQPCFKLWVVPISEVFSSFIQRTSAGGGQLCGRTGPRRQPVRASKELVDRGSQDLYSGMAAIVDPCDEAGPDVPRDPSLTHDSWLRSRLSSLHRGGLANDPQQLLAMYTVGIARSLNPQTD